MAGTTNLSTLKINFLTQSQYDSATINDDEVYILTDSGKGPKQRPLQLRATQQLI